MQFPGHESKENSEVVFGRNSHQLELLQQRQNFLGEALEGMQKSPVHSLKISCDLTLREAFYSDHINKPMHVCPVFVGISNPSFDVDTTFLLGVLQEACFQARFKPKKGRPSITVFCFQLQVVRHGVLLRLEQNPSVMMKLWVP